MFYIRRITVINILIIAGFFSLAGCSGRLTIGAGQIERDRQLRNAEKLYQSLYWIDRRNAILIAADYNTPRSFNLLVKGTSDTHTRVKIEAIKALGSYKNPDSFQILTDTCKTNDVLIKYYSLQSLIMINDSKAAPLYIEGLNHPDWMIRDASIKGLLEIEDSSVRKYSVEYTLKALNDPDENVRITAMTYCKIKDKRIGEKLCSEIAKNAKGDKFTYLSATLKAVDGYKLDDNSRNILIGLLTHQNNELRVLALRALKSSREAQRD